MNVFNSMRKHASTLFLIGAGTTQVGALILGIGATPRAVSLVQAEQEKKGEKLTKREVVKAGWKPYIPATMCEIASIGCLVGAGCTSAHNMAAATAAIALREAQLDKYVAAAKKVVGEEKEKEIKEEVVKKDISEIPSDDSTAINTGYGLERFWDPYGGRMILSTQEKIKQGGQYIIRDINDTGEADMNSFYFGINVPETLAGEVFIWKDEHIDTRNFEVTLDHYNTPDGRLCWLIGFNYPPETRR